MNAQIEAGFASILRKAIPSLVVREATSSAPLPDEKQILIIEVPELEHVVGPLHRATVRLVLASNAFDSSRAQHSQLASALAPALASPISNAMNFDLAAGGLFLRGIHIRSQSDQVEDTHWRSTMELVAGISTAPCSS